MSRITIDINLSELNVKQWTEEGTGGRTRGAENKKNAQEKSGSRSYNETKINMGDKGWGGGQLETQDSNGSHPSGASKSPVKCAPKNKLVNLGDIDLSAKRRADRKT